MNFQNSYILIFNQPITAKRFTKILLSAVAMLLIFSVLLKYLNISMNSNDVIKEYQEKKINALNLEDIETIIIGDSSAGNSINATVFSDLSTSKTLNLSLTGSWGIIGSVGIAKKAYEINPNIKNVIIIQTLDIWDRPFVKKSIHEFFSFKERVDYLGIRSILDNEINVKEIQWFYEYLWKKIRGKEKTVVDKNNDYLLQKKKKYFTEINAFTKIGQDKKEEYRMLENFCVKRKLNCIYLNGPILDKIAQKSEDFLDTVYKKFMRQSKIQYVDKIFTYDNSMLGDAEDHIHPEYKDEVTKEYWKEIDPLLIKGMN